MAVALRARLGGSEEGVPLRGRGREQATIPCGAGLWLELSATGQGLCAARPDGITVAADAGLLNMAELRADLGVEGAEPAQVIAEGYARWGRAIWGRLEGDYAVLLWDPGARRLLAVRDAMGVRPLFWGRGPGGWAFGSSIAEVLRESGRRPEPCGRVVVEDLLDRWPATGPDDCFFEGVNRVPPGCVVQVPAACGEPELCALDRAVREPEEAPLAENARRLRDRLTATVRECIGPFPTGILVSGGLDSGGLWALARASAPDLVHGLAAVFRRDRECDERDHLERLLAASGGPVLLLEADDVLPLASPPPVPRLPEEPLEGPYHGMIAHLLARAAALGVSRVPSGFGADELFTGSSLYLADDLARGDLRRVRATLSLLPWKQRIAAAGRTAAALLPRGDSWRLRSSPAETWVPREARRMARPSPRRKGARPRARAEERSRVESPLRYIAVQWLAACARSFGFDMSFPYLDRRIVAHALAIPSEQKWRLGLGKVVLRRALAAALPAPLTNRRDKAVLTPLLDRALAAGCRGFIEEVSHGRLAGEGLVDPAAFRRGYARYLGGDVQRRMDLWRVVRLERWLRSANERVLGGERT